MPKDKEQVLSASVGWKVYRIWQHARRYMGLNLSKRAIRRQRGRWKGVVADAAEAPTAE